MVFSRSENSSELIFSTCPSAHQICSLNTEFSGSKGRLDSPKEPSEGFNRMMLNPSEVYTGTPFYDPMLLSPAAQRVCLGCSEPITTEILFGLFKRRQTINSSPAVDCEPLKPKQTHSISSSTIAKVVPGVCRSGTEDSDDIKEHFHSSCLVCGKCGYQLSEIDKSCWFVDSEVICRPCKYRMTHCHRCKMEVSSDAWVHKLNDLPFHISCFTCSTCHRQLAKGEQCGMLDDRLLCQDHFSEVLSGKSDSEQDSGTRPKTKRVRTSFTPEQLAILQSHFDRDHNPDGSDLEKIAGSARLNKRVTQVWFQNARARKKKNERGSGVGGSDVGPSLQGCNLDISGNGGRPPSSCSSSSLSPSLPGLVSGVPQSSNCHRSASPNLGNGGGGTMGGPLPIHPSSSPSPHGYLTSLHLSSPSMGQQPHSAMFQHQLHHSMQGMAQNFEIDQESRSCVTSSSPGLRDVSDQFIPDFYFHVGFPVSMSSGGPHVGNNGTNMESFRTPHNGMEQIW